MRSERITGAVEIGPVSFTVPDGSITAMVGPNGSGKTTTLLRMIEVVRGSGFALFDGERYGSLPSPTQTVGVMFDGIPTYPGRTIRAHMKIVAAAMRIDRQRRNEVLDMVGAARCVISAVERTLVWNASASRYRVHACQ